MTPETVISMGRHALEITLELMAPPLLTALIVGLVISIFQAATQINEATLSFIPKFLGVLASIIILGPWMLTIILDYMREVFTSIPIITHY
jgi:flagellar biosynthetic protein FliQ